MSPVFAAPLYYSIPISLHVNPIIPCPCPDHLVMSPVFAALLYHSVLVLPHVNPIDYESYAPTLIAWTIHIVDMISKTLIRFVNHIFILLFHVQCGVLCKLAELWHCELF